MGTHLTIREESGVGLGEQGVELPHLAGAILELLAEVVDVGLEQLHLPRPRRRLVNALTG